MVRKLALAVSIALGTLNVPAHALGLGELNSKSLLNQNFNGDITLLSVAPEELDAVRVKLADAEAFGRAGVERPFYLSLLKFEPTVGTAGKAVIRVSSDFPIREPFLNFLVEVNWPNGRLLREYTVLLDPPTTTMRRPPKPAAATVQSRPAPARAAPVVQRPAAQAPTIAPAPSRVVAASAGSDYGPVQANETAWSIAKKLRSGGVSMEQMMMALLAANPQAFVDGNINRLRRGRILRVPALDEIQQLTRRQARQAYREQQDQWLARRDARLQAKAAEDAVPSTDAATPADDQLRIATSRPEGEGEAGAGEDDATQPTATDLQSRLIVARENAETSRQQAETLRSEVDELQARLADMQKLLSLKDDQLARLQDQVVTGETEAAPGDEVKVPATPAQALDDGAEALEAASETAESVPVEPIAAEETSLEAPAETPVDALDDVLADLESAATDSVAEVEPAGVMSDAPVPDFVPPPGYVLPEVAPLVDVDAIVEGRMVEPAAEAVVAEVTPRVNVDAIVEGRVTTLADQAEVAEAPITALIDVVDPTSDIAAPADTPDEIVIADTTDEIVIADEVAPPAAAVDAEPSATTPVGEPLAVEPDVAAPATDEPVSKPQILPPALATLVQNNIVPLAGGGVALLGLIGWLATRRRKQVPEEQPASAPVVAAGELPAVDEPAMVAETLNDLPDSAFLDEFSPNDINSLQDETGEVDPVSEADVYIAYGRYQQAQELLRQALERDPDRLALKHKLLEVHYATRDAEAFAQLAQEMVDAGQDAADEAAWARAQDMGRELQPDNPLFALDDGRGGSPAGVAAAAGAAAAGAAVAAVDDDTLSIDDLDLSDLDDEYEVQKPDEESLDAPSEVSITLDLDETDDSLAAISPDLEIPDIPETLSLEDVGSLSLDELDDAAGASKEESTVDSDTISDSFDLDSMMAEAEAAIDEEDTTLNLDSDFSADELQAELDQLSDLSVLDPALDKAGEPSPVAEPPAGLGLVEEDKTPAEHGLDQPIDLDEAFASGDAEAPETETLDLDTSDDAADEDDVSTKLDLARAYVEMGDEDGARSILEEVVSEGSAGQKDEAAKLLTALA